MKKNHKSNLKLKTIVSGALVVAIVFGIVIALVSHHKKSPIPEPINIPTTKTATKPTPTSKNFDSKGDTGNSTPPASTPQTIAAASLISPYGTFVSNHSPSLSGSSAPSQEESTCTSNPGVSCYIEFTNGSVIRKLPTQLTDESGSTSWNWDVKKSGLTVGNWHITAVVTSGSNSKSRQDSLLLSVSK